MNVDDSVGFLVPINENYVIGITIDSGQFLLFSFDNPKKASTHVSLQVTGGQESAVTGIR